MVDRIGLGEGLVLLWRDDLEVTIQNYSLGYIDVLINNWIPSGGYFFTGFYGHWNTTQRKQSWQLLQYIGQNWNE